MYLVSDFAAYNLANGYAGFWRILTWYRMYCVAKFGKNKSDYKKGLESLKDAFLELSEYDDVSKHIKEPATTLIEKIEKRLQSKRFTDEDVQFIGNLLWDFEKQCEDFTSKYLNTYLREAAESDLPKGMASILQLLENDENGSAIVDSFRYFDGFLQKLLNASPHDYYGETLVNLAFSPGDGKIRLGTHENEQRGLRNLVSGMYALFRNPAAHRDIFDRSNGILKFDSGEQAAATITVMLSLLAKLVYETTFINLDTPIRAELIKAAQKYGWNQDILQFGWRFQYSWYTGLLPEAKSKFPKDYQIGVTLKEDNQGPHLQVTIRAELEKEDLDEFLQNIRQASNIRTVFHK